MSRFTPALPEPSSVQPPPAVPRSCLVATPTQGHDENGRIPYTANRETDSRTALNRGLAEYLLSLPPFVAFGGRVVRLNKVFDVWPDSEEERDHPSAVVYSKGEGTYAGSGLAPIVDANCVVDDDPNTFLIKNAELEITITLEVATNDPEERIALAMMLEDALWPVDWMTGFQLELPHYHNLRGKYLPVRQNFPDNEEDVFTRNRHLIFNFDATVPVVRLKKLTPVTEIRSTVTVTDPCP